ncbi:hypothetical protein FB451DRAFT_1294320 [Mycena latifolia]|nr:hypothetical protein FB451DRAFT_1294320 [Mycena latifolia]
MPSSKKKAPNRRDKTDGTGDEEYEEGAVKFCSMHECSNYRNLKQCGRCKCATYCSVECQRKHWVLHKPLCDFNATTLNEMGGETVFQRNLRNWVVRFDTTLITACIRALKLKYDWENVGKAFLVLSLEPRPHPNAGSRWRIKRMDLVSPETAMIVMDELGMAIASQYRDSILPLHNKKREAVRESSGGTVDYAAVILMATNTGPDALEGEHSSTMRFKPVDVYRSVAAQMAFEEYEADWRQDLMDQVHNDRPMKRAIPK